MRLTAGVGEWTLPVGRGPHWRCGAGAEAAGGRAESGRLLLGPRAGGASRGPQLPSAVLALTIGPGRYPVAPLRLLGSFVGAEPSSEEVAGLVETAAARGDHGAGNEPWTEDVDLAVGAPQEQHPGFVLQLRSADGEQLTAGDVGPLELKWEQQVGGKAGQSLYLASAVRQRMQLSQRENVFP